MLNKLHNSCNKSSVHDCSSSYTQVAQSVHFLAVKLDHCSHMYQNDQTTNVLFK